MGGYGPQIPHDADLGVQWLCNMMEMDEKTLLGPMNGTFTLKKHPELFITISVISAFPQHIRSYFYLSSLMHLDSGKKL